MIYLDHNATTPILPEVRDVVRSAMEQHWATRPPRMPWQGGIRPDRTARERLAAIIGASAKEIFFTSGGTEADNLAIMGTLDRYKDGKWSFRQLSTRRSMMRRIRLRQKDMAYGRFPLETME